MGLGLGVGYKLGKTSVTGFPKYCEIGTYDPRKHITRTCIRLKCRFTQQGFTVYIASESELEMSGSLSKHRKESQKPRMARDVDNFSPVE